MTILKKFLSVFMFALLLCACSDMKFDLPQGPEGKSAYDIWKTEVEAGKIDWPKDKTGVSDFLVYIKGEKGDAGQSAYDLWKIMISQGNVPDPHNPNQMWPANKNTEVDFWDYLTGRDGQTPHIGDNGNWWIGGSDTGFPARGEDGIDGKDGLSAYEIWKDMVSKDQLDWPKDQVTQTDFFLYLKGKDGENGITPHVGTNGNWWIGGSDTGVPARGEDGVTPHIGNNENWWIGDSDTGIPARGQKGDKGDKGLNGETPFIKDGYWWIGDENTQIPAQGDKGDKGDDGITPEIKNGIWWIGEQNTGIPAQGADGISPSIGNDGNWWIGDENTQIPARGPKGETGASGKSAYELWVDDVNKGVIKDKNDNVWPETETTMADFYRYLSGKDGENGIDGLSAYETWKKMAEKGTLMDPKNPNTPWPASKVTEADFFEYLTGKDGINGINGLSAYELWKQELEDRKDTPDALINHRDGTVWDPTRNSIDDFFEYLRGKDGEDGEDGEDGKPGEPGMPGATVTIIKGVPNVIAQYSQAEYGEYVRTTDGGVLYIVYDTQGAPAPGAVVSGLPGLEASKEYTANERGEFIIPKEDLPSIEDVDSRWGKTTSVTIGGETLQSAKNTYVPNRIDMRIVMMKLHGYTPNGAWLDRLVNIDFAIQRKTSPDSEWENLPTYLPRPAGDFKFETWLCDANNPKNTIKKIYGYTDTKTTDKGYIYIYFNTGRFVKKDGNYNQDNNYQDSEWDGTEKYITLKGTTPYYGETIDWNGVADLPAYQMAPTLKKIVLRKASKEGDNTIFQSSTFTFDLSKFDFSIIYEEALDATITPAGLERITCKKIEDEALLKNEKYFSLVFNHNLPEGSWSVNTDGNKASFNNPSVNTSFIYLKSSVSARNKQLWCKEWCIGSIQENNGTYYFKKINDQVPDVEVVYEP